MPSENPFKDLCTALPKPDGGEYRKYYSFTALNDVEKIIDWEITSPKQVEIPFKPARVLLQDFTGVPVVVDLACMRDAMNNLDGDSNKINPLVDVARHENVVQANMDLEFHRNSEWFAFLKWGSTAFQNMLVVPPGSGIVHQRIKIAKSNKPLPGPRTRSRANAPIEIEKEPTRAATITEKQPKKAGTNREATSSYRPPVLIILRAWCWHLHLKNL
ncbi:hypothetical protein POM88_053168 [Heracleum sosnowskyi]|uniref:Aconitase/3-isopropylmalate dehydratase large subunit alpha/beta/alpha domain-containing protein n=1 Tax=Heracleum sosnowskyi TaxID=360622 RepID=A0AAD8GQW7_9APIA|nr:hypothetical protein POM88_053168 [Heracleum sosnowskyi]